MKQFRLFLAVLTLKIAGFGLSADVESLRTSKIWTHGLTDGAGVGCTITNISSPTLQ
jgi:hypothetical protein